MTSEKNTLLFSLRYYYYVNGKRIHFKETNPGSHLHFHAVGYSPMHIILGMEKAAIDPRVNFPEVPRITNSGRLSSHISAFSLKLPTYSHPRIPQQTLCPFYPAKFRLHPSLPPPPLAQPPTHFFPSNHRQFPRLMGKRAHGNEKSRKRMSVANSASRPPLWRNCLSRWALKICIHLILRRESG